MSTHIRTNSIVQRRIVYHRAFVAASALTVIGFLFWPLELDIYCGQDGTRDWLWNDTPVVSTETAPYWDYYSLRPLLYLSIVLALVSLVLYKRAIKSGG